MSKKDQNYSEMFEDQNDMCFNYPPMFRYPCGDRQKVGMSQGMVPMPGEAESVNPEPTTETVISDTGYLQGYLKTLIGRTMRVSFLIGTSLLVDRVGILQEVGISYIVLQQIDTNIRVVCDLYSIKFVDVYERAIPGV